MKADRKKPRKPHVVLTPGQKREMAFLKGRGVSRKELVRMFDVSPRTVQNVKPIASAVVFAGDV